MGETLCVEENVDRDCLVPDQTWWILWWLMKERKKERKRKRKGVYIYVGSDGVNEELTQMNQER